MPNLDPSFVLLFAAFIMPGIITLSIYSHIAPQETKEIKNLVLEALCFSIINFVLLYWFIQFLLDKDYLLLHPFLSWIIALLCFVVAPVIWPFALRKGLSWLGEKGLFLVQSKTAWVDFFSQASEGCWIMVKMKDGEIIGGRFAENSYASAYPNPGHIYIEELWNVSKDKTFDAPIVGAPGIILRPDDYDYLWVYKGAN